jgi:transposase InsO family protein
VRLRPEHPNPVWSYDLVKCRTSDGRAVRLLTVIDESTRECLAIDGARKVTAADVLDRLCALFVGRGVPGHVRSDNGPAFAARAVRSWLGGLGVKTLFIEPGSPWENGSVESFNGTLRDELPNPEVFDTFLEARVRVERWRRDDNRVRPHSSLGYRPPAPEAFQPGPPAPVARERQPERWGWSHPRGQVTPGTTLRVSPGLWFPEKGTAAHGTI